MSDPKVSSYLQKFSVVASTENYINSSSDDTRSIAAAGKEPKDYKLTYVLNKNKKKFHYPWCSSVNDIKNENREEFYGTRDEIPDDYVPCQRCNP